MAEAGVACPKVARFAADPFVLGPIMAAAAKCTVAQVREVGADGIGPALVRNLYRGTAPAPDALVVLPQDTDGVAAVVREQLAMLPERFDFTVIAGRTGSGKTTITRLLFRLYDPATGAIRLGGDVVMHLLKREKVRAAVLGAEDEARRGVARLALGRGLCLPFRVERRPARQDRPVDHR